ncbi:hypothetical protein L2649_13125 [Thermoactinomyces vulgaris]|uniref:hypothetical protein n=1 Tax=Thermoactinomyces vulgaris TaxID=2026 RepID=UPI001F37E6A4|nr:hypothetical protein [Thermoactinomyces vulgaris]MCF6136094.1 hypothetical protein [Thermoactinomyces vulgaris]
MSRLKRLKLGEEKAVMQKTVRIPADLFQDFDLLMKEAGIDSFNLAVVKLIELEVQEWKEEKKKEEKKKEESETKSASKKTRKTSSKKQTKKDSENDPDKESKKE